MILDIVYVNSCMYNTFGTVGPLDLALLALLKYNRRRAVELTAASVSEPLELAGLGGRAIAMATTAVVVADVVADAIETWACVTDTVIAPCVLTAKICKM